MLNQYPTFIFWTEKTFQFIVDFFKWGQLCVNQWVIQSADPDKLVQLQLFFEPAAGTVGTGTGFYRVRTGQTEQEKGDYTGWRHALACVRNAEIALGKPTGTFLTPATNKIGDLFGIVTRPNIPPAFYPFKQGSARCSNDAPDNFVSGALSLFPSTIPLLTLDSRSENGVFEALDSYYAAEENRFDVRFPRGDYLSSRYFNTRFVIPVFQLSFVLRESFPTGNLERVVYARKKRFAGRADLPIWREQHAILELGRKFRKQQLIVTEDNEADGRGREGTGIRKVLAKAGDVVSDALLKAITKEVKKRSKVAGAAAGFAVKLAKAALKKRAATAERQRKRGLKPTVRSKRVANKEEVQARYEKEVKAAARGVEISQVKQDKELERILRREKAAIKRQNRKILEQRRRWLKHQNKIEREKRKFAKQVARLVKEADKKALRKFSFRQKRPCLPTQQRRRRKRKRLTSRGRASRR